MTAFQLDGETSLSDCIWTGGFFSETETEETEFLIRIFEDDAGSPGSQVGLRTVTDFSTEPADGLTRFTASLSPPIESLPDPCWLSVQLAGSAVPQWGLSDIEAPTNAVGAAVLCPETDVPEWTVREVELQRASSRSVSPPSSPILESASVDRQVNVSPNPSSGLQFFESSVQGSTRATLRIYDASGRQVRQLFPAAVRGGMAAFAWDGLSSSGHPVPAGVYFGQTDVGADRTSQHYSRLTIVRR